MKEIIIKYLEESNQSKNKLSKRIRINTYPYQINQVLLYNHMPTIPVFEKLYKCMCEDGFIKYADELREQYKNKLREKNKELLEFLED